MQRFARIDAGIVVEIIELPDGVDPSAAFHPSIAAQLMPATAEAVPGWHLTGNALTPPQSTLVPERPRKRRSARQHA